MNTITLNGVRSDTIQGLLIQSLPPISKPPMRVNVEEIDGRNGDIITDLGYQAYDKTITIGLRGEFDINDVISFFNSEGTVVFSNEPDKYYRYKIYQQIDFERLIRFRVATVTMHVQPFKYPLNETPISVSSLIWEGTDYDQTPYIFRAVSDSSVEAGNREVIEQITGGTVAWNQSLEEGLRSSENTTKVAYNRCNATFDSTTHEYTLTSLQNQGTSGFYYGANQGAVINPNHVHIISFEAKAPKTFNVKIGLNPGPATKTGFSQNVYHSIGAVVKIDSSTREFLFNFNADNAWDGSETVYARNLMVIDITQMFGTTIADYIYSLEQSTAGAGVSLFKSLFPKDYYAYNAGELMSVKTSARETVGKNLLNVTSVTVSSCTFNVDSDGWITAENKTSDPRQWAYANCQWFVTLPKGTYCLNIESDSAWESVSQHGVRLISANNETIMTRLTNGSGSFTLTELQTIGVLAKIYGGSIRLQIEGGSTSTSYEPYEKHSYPLSPIELRGIPKLVNNKIQYDGDIYKADGSVTIRYGIRAYQSGDATGETMITDGTNTVYALSTPTTETTTPYTETQICDADGTEEFIDERDVQIPVGHKTKYEQIDPINIEITNSGNVPSMPTYRIEGSGSIDVNIDGLHAVTVDMSNINAITINSEEMNAYNDTGGFANRSVTGSYENLSLPSGNNTLEIDGDGVIDLLVTNYERWL